MESCIFYAQELIAILYPKAKPDDKLSEQAALAAMGQACDEVRRLSYLRSLEDGDIIPNDWISSFEGLEIKQDSKGFYTTLPATPIALRRDTGIRRVWLSCDPYNLIMPTLNGFRGMYNTSAIKNLGGRRGYFPQGNTVRFLQEMDTTETISMDLFASALSLGEDARFPADDSIINEILNRAVQIWQVQKQIPESPISQGTSA